MWQVAVHHHDKAIVRGDLEDKFELIQTENFKTKKAAKEWIVNQLARKSGTTRTEWHNGDRPSYSYCWTGVTWQHENSGEQMEEYYQYTLKKVKLRG